MPYNITENTLVVGTMGNWNGYHRTIPAAAEAEEAEAERLHVETLHDRPDGALLRKARTRLLVGHDRDQDRREDLGRDALPVVGRARPRLLPGEALSASRLGVGAVDGAQGLGGPGELSRPEGRQRHLRGGIAALA